MCKNTTVDGCPTELILIIQAFSFLLTNALLYSVPLSGLEKSFDIVQGGIWQYLNMVLVGRCYWHRVDRGQGCSKHPSMNGTAP